VRQPPERLGLEKPPASKRVPGRHSRTLGHHGVLFLDKLTEFRRDAIGSLRGPGRGIDLGVERANGPGLPTGTTPCKGSDLQGGTRVPPRGWSASGEGLCSGPARWGEKVLPSPHLPHFPGPSPQGHHERGSPWLSGAELRACSLPRRQLRLLLLPQFSHELGQIPALELPDLIELVQIAPLRRPWASD
jgi:hypothetical protein